MPIFLPNLPIFNQIFYLWRELSFSPVLTDKSYVSFSWIIFRIWKLMLKIVALIRNIFLLFILMAVTGCLHNVNELMDHSICERSREIIDLEPLTHFDKKTEASKTDSETKNNNPKIITNKIDESLEFSKNQSDLSSAKNRLLVPPDLPGSKDPPIKLPIFTKENMELRKEALAKLYPPLPVLTPEPELAMGPDGKPYSLSDLQKIALTSSPKIKQAVAAVAAARGGAIQAGLYPNPDIGYEGDTMQTMGTAGYQGGYIQQTIVTASKLPTARQAALMDVRISEMALRKAETDLAREVRNGYFAVLVADQNIKVSRALASLSSEVYDNIIEQVKKGGFAAPYEPFQIRVLALQAYGQLVQAKNRHTSAWKQLTAAMGVPGLPLSQLAGDINISIPVYKYDECVKRVTLLHTNVGTAEFELLKAQSLLKLAQVTPIPDVTVRVLLQRDYTFAPNALSPSVQVGMPVPIWNRNQGNILQAESLLVSASEAKNKARNQLTADLAEAFERYENNRVLLGYYRDQILPDQIRTYRGLFERFNSEIKVGEGDTLTFADVVNAQNILSASVVQYLQVLGAMWTSVVDIANLLQTDDLFQIAGEKVPTEWVNSSEALEQLIKLPSNYPCSPLNDPKYRGVDGKWMPAVKSELEKSKSTTDGQSVQPLTPKVLPVPNPNQPLK